MNSLLNLHSSKSIRSAALAVALLSLTIPAARAGHVYAGIIDTNGSGTLDRGDALSFVGNSTGLVVTGASLGVQTMTLATVGAQAGLFITTNISFTALAGPGVTQASENGTGYIAANPYGATLGSYIKLEISGVTGPTGAHFLFFDHGNTTSTPTFSIATGSTNLGTTYGFLLTNDGLTYPDFPEYVGDGVHPTSTPNGIPPANPYGHIHGRTMAVDQPGTYTVDYILHDLSGQQADSTPFTVTYTVAAVPEPTAVALLGGGALLLGVFRRRRSLS